MYRKWFILVPLNQRRGAAASIDVVHLWFQVRHWPILPIKSDVRRK